MSAATLDGIVNGIFSDEFQFAAGMILDEVTEPVAFEENVTQEVAKVQIELTRRVAA